jgi:hypothetical protein
MQIGLPGSCWLQRRALPTTAADAYIGVSLLIFVACDSVTFCDCDTVTVVRLDQTSTGLVMTQPGRPTRPKGPKRGAS